MTRLAWILAAAALALPAHATDKGKGKGNDKGPCKNDFEKYCADVEPGEGRIVKCMKEHEAQLSEGCRNTIGKKAEKRSERREDFKDACADDVKKVCGGVEPGDGRIKECMKSNMDKLSGECKAQLGKMKAGMEKHQGKAKHARKACADDLEKFCKDVKPGDGRLVKCLKENEANLSPDCRAMAKKGGDDKDWKHGKKEKKEKKELRDDE